MDSPTPCLYHEQLAEQIAEIREDVKVIRKLLLGNGEA